ncbi:hypothetical protein [Streptomyces virginiae]|uniref:hypothetical protein n=1 Tax=Streptomyces virginiae TaxID=1961 RepID=UPI00342D4A83
MIVIAALVIRTAITELRHPGSARRQWACATNPRAGRCDGRVNLFDTTRRRRLRRRNL